MFMWETHYVMINYFWLIELIILEWDLEYECIEAKGL